MFNRFTDPARRSIVLAQGHARQLGACRIDPAHLLLALADESHDAAFLALEAAGLTKDHLDRRLGPPASLAHLSGPIPFAKASQRLIDAAARISADCGDNYVAPEHLLVALARSGDQVVLDALGPDVTARFQRIDGVRETAGDLAAPAPPDASTQARARRLAGLLNTCDLSTLDETSRALVAEATEVLGSVAHSCDRQ
jgi:ATP-dependent Clp protease ATP-binding subunit ClpA